MSFLFRLRRVWWTKLKRSNEKSRSKQLSRSKQQSRRKQSARKQRRNNRRSKTTLCGSDCHSAAIIFTLDASWTGLNSNYRRSTSPSAHSVGSHSRWNTQTFCPLSPVFSRSLWGHQSYLRNFLRTLLCLWSIPRTKPYKWEAGKLTAIYRSQCKINHRTQFKNKSRRSL